MKWIKASQRLPEKTGWYFVKKNKLKNSTENSVKEIFHFDWLKDKKEVPDYWCEIDVWLDESPSPLSGEEIKQFDSAGDIDKLNIWDELGWQIENHNNPTVVTWCKENFIPKSLAQPPTPEPAGELYWKQLAETADKILMKQKQLNTNGFEWQEYLQLKNQKPEPQQNQDE